MELRESIDQAPAGQAGSPAAALHRALDGYADWLKHIDEVRSDLGISRLHAVAEIRRKHCPGTSQTMTDLLVGQIKLSELLFARELKLARGEASEPLKRSNECATLVASQMRAISTMRAACNAARGRCIGLPPGPRDSSAALIDSCS